MELSDGSFEYFPGPARQPIANPSLLCIICLRSVSGRRPVSFVSDGKQGKLWRWQRVCTRTRLTQTLEPSRDPSYTSS